MRQIFLLLLLLTATLGLEARQPALRTDTGALQVRQFSAEKINRFRSDPAFHYTKVAEPPDTLLGRWWNWLAKRFDDLMNHPGTAKAIRVVLILLAAGTLIFFVITLSGMNKGGLWGKNNRGGGLAYSVSDEDIHAINFAEAIQQAVSTGNYRLAIRLLYLQSLKQLADRGLISWQIDKTNTAYISELQDASLRQQFHRLTMQFESNWYGNTPVREEEFAGVQELFEQFNSQLK